MIQNVLAGSNEAVLSQESQIPRTFFGHAQSYSGCTVSKIREGPKKGMTRERYFNPSLPHQLIITNSI
jgi:hypothetical protein